MTLKYEESHQNDSARSNREALNDDDDDQAVHLYQYKIKRVDCFADYIIIIYKDKIFFDIFKKNGKLKERRYLRGDTN